MTPPDWVPPYAAGLIDGDGCISIASHRTGLTIAVAVNMTDRRGIDLLKDYYGGKFILVKRAKGTENWKPVHMWRVEARKAERLLRDIRPFLQVKREQCELALSMRDHMRAGGILSRGSSQKIGCEKDIAILAFRNSAKTQMHQLNKRGLN